MTQPEQEGESPVTVLRRQTANPLIAVLLGSGAIAIALGDLVDGAVVLGVVAANALIGFLQEWRAGRAIEALGSMIPDEARVVRDGRRVVMPATEVRSKAGSNRAASSRPMVRSISLCGCSSLVSMSASISG